MEPTRIRERRNDSRGDASVEHGGDLYGHIGRLNSRVSALELANHDRAAEKGEPDHLGHAVAAVGIVRSLEAVFKPLELSIQKDASNGAQLTQELKRVGDCLERLESAHGELTAALQAHTRALDEHTATLRTPKVRTGRVMTPEGPVEMHITESRGTH